MLPHWLLPHLLQPVPAGEGFVDVDEFLAAMLANSNYTRTKDAVRRVCTR